MKIKILLLPKFKAEAELLLESYFKNPKIIRLSNNKNLYINEAKGLALGICGSGKVNNASYMTTVLCSREIDISEALIISTGCAGSNSDYSVMGDVVIASEVVDYDLGFECYEPKLVWFYNDIFKDSCHKVLNEELVDKAYETTKDIALESTDISMKYSSRKPKVLKGTIISSDTYWKGLEGHRKALKVVEHYKCKEPYAVVEMEDVACAAVLDQYGMLNRYLAIRSSVNLDVFLGDDTPEKIWTDCESYADRVTKSNSETLDIFPVAMKNLFKVIDRIIEEILNTD